MRKGNNMEGQYSEKVMEHFRNPRNVGEIPDADGIGNVGNAVCGDIMKLYIKVDANEIITDAKFKTFGCLPPETEIVLPGGGWKRIDSISKGENIINNEGREAIVGEIFKNKYSGPMVNITPFVSTYNRFSATPNHPIFAIKRSSLPFSRKASSKCDWLRIKRERLLSTIPEYTPAGILEEGDYLAYTPNTEVKDNPLFDRNVMRLLGYYLSEGYLIAKERAVAFAFNKNEKHTIEDAKNLIYIYTGKTAKDRTRSNVTEVHISSTKLAVFLKRHCGSLARHKILSRDIMHLPYDKQKEMLKTYMIGDGNFYRRRPQGSFTYRAITASINLAAQIQEILARGGIFSSIKEVLKTDCVIEGRRIKPSLMYTITFKLERKHEFVRKAKNYYLVPIRKIEKKYYNGYVHNLQINDWTNSYLVKGFVVHNCGAAIATSSMVTELVKGKTIPDALKISNHAVAEALGGLPKIKMHCSVLAEQALRSAIDDYLAKKKVRA